MFRQSPIDAAFRAFSGGGARSLVSSVQDSHFMQEMGGNFMKNEARKAIEAPQNFGFTSVVKDAIMSKLGGMVGSAETMMSFIGGNRSLPVAGNMDDRRHRLMGLDQGDSAMFSTQGRKQQALMTDDGFFSHAPNDKTIRMALLDEKSEKDMSSQSYQAQQTAQEPGGPAHKAALAAVLAGKIRDITEPLTEPIPGVPTLYDSGGTGSATDGTNAGGTGAGGMKMGQKSLKDKNQKAKIFIDCTKDNTRCAGTNVQLIQASSSSGGGGSGGGGSRDTSGSGSSSGGSSQQSGNVLAEVNKNGKFYCGGTASKGKYALVVTVKGPTINVPGRIG